MHGKALGHLTAMFTVILWGTTFISTKVLLTGFQPVEILFIRFVLGLAALTAACPKRIKGTTWRQELTFAAAGLCGVTLYFLAENMALTYTTASNVGVIASAAPLFTAILARFVWKDGERFTHPVYLLNLLFLGLGASAACFASWNFAVGILGAVKTSAYIYGAPVITVAASALILHEPVTPAIAAGTMLTLAGLVLSQRRPGRKNNRG